jgi:tetratricopeptide (TPR) repeat protein
MAAAVAAAGLLTAGPVRAGLYHPAEPPVGPTNNPQLFLSLLSDFKGLRQPQNPLRKHYLARAAELETKESRGDLTVEDRLNLSAYYIRLEQPEKAVGVLGPVANAAQGNFMVLSNLATAHELAGRLDLAVRYAEQSLKQWPAMWPGLSKAQLYWLSRAEKYHVALLKLRYLETSRRGGKTAVPERPDELFPKVRFVNADGSYAPGELEAVQMADLPNDAALIVEQLLLWSPNDARLEWLYAELLAALGNPNALMAANTVFNNLVKQGFNSKELGRHRHAVNVAAETVVRLNRVLADAKGPGAWVQLLWYAVPRGATLESGVGALAAESAWAARAILDKRPSRPAAPAARAERPAEATAKAAKGWLPEARSVLVSFAAGVLVTIFCILQVREMRRRHQGDAADKGGAGTEPTA